MTSTGGHPLYESAAKEMRAFKRDYGKCAGSAGRLSRSMGSVMPPALLPIRTSAEPSPLPGFTAASRMWRISAWVLRPLCLARRFNAVNVEAVSFRTVTIGMDAGSLQGGWIITIGGRSISNGLDPRKGGQ